MQIGVDNLHDRNEEIKHLRQTSIELKNKVNDLNIVTAVLNEKINDSNIQGLIHDAKEASKRLTKLEVRNDQLKHQIKLNDDIRKEEENNKILKAKMEAYENMGDDPIIQLQTKELVEQEAKLKKIQKNTENIELIHKKDEQLNQLQMNNAVKANILNNSIGDFNDSVGSEIIDAQQANAMYDAAINTEKQEGIHIENKEESDRLRQKIISYKTQFDPNGDRWKAINGNQIYPYLRNGTNIFNINDPTEIDEIGKNYVPNFEKKIYYGTVEDNTSSSDVEQKSSNKHSRFYMPTDLASGDSGNFNNSNVVIEEEEDED